MKLLILLSLIVMALFIFAIFLLFCWISLQLRDLQEHKRELSRKEDSILTEIDDLRSAVSDLTAADGALATSIAGAIAELQVAEHQLAALKAQETISPQDVENAAQFVKTVTTHLAAAKAALDAAAAPPIVAPATATDNPPQTPPATGDGTAAGTPAASAAAAGATDASQPPTT